MKWVWTLITVVLAVTGVIGLYNEIEQLVTGGSGGSTIMTVARIGIAILCLILAPKAFAKARSA